jgi:hypothetical protein
MSKKSSDSNHAAQVKINIKYVPSGEPPRISLELKRRSFIRSVREAFVQGFVSLHEKVLARDLQLAQVKASQRLEEEV